MYRLRLGRSVGLLREDFYDIVNRAGSEGLESVDFDICGKWDLDNKEDTCKEIEKGLLALKESGLYFNGVHIPFGRAWDFSSVDEAVRANAVAVFAKLASIIDPYSPRCYIVHGSYEPIADGERSAKLEALKRSLREMVAVTGTTIAVEILPRTCLLNCSAEAIELLDALGNEQIGICVDVNHFLKEKSEDGVLALGKRIVTTHISDHDYADERHWMPGDGKIDWMALIAAFEKIGYSGVFNYEIGRTVSDIKANYDGLFEEYNRI